MNYLQRCPVVLFKDLERDRKPDVLTEDEINALLDELKDPCHTMVRLAACTGLRVSELLGLKWADIRFDLQEIHPVRAIVDNHIGELKTEPAASHTYGRGNF